LALWHEAKKKHINKLKNIMKYTSKIRLIKRLLSAPFILGLLLVTHNLFVFVRWYHFIVRGGEFINYDNKGDFKAIQDIFEELKKQNGIENK
jgi:hypothetical protein